MIEVHDMFPYLRVRGASEAIEFYKRAFGAHELYRLSEPGGRIGHAELKVGDRTLMISDEYPEHGIEAPQEGQRRGGAIHLHISNVDAVMERAVAAGAKVIRELQDHFYGERSGTILDPFGHEWILGQQIEQVTQDQIIERFKAMYR